MTVTLPSGWINFEGGGSDPELCGDSTIPPSINTVPPGGALDCDPLNLIQEIDLLVSGGIPPFTWTTTEGRITVTGIRTATLQVGDLWDVSTQIIIDGVSLNPCHLPAYVYRGRTIWGFVEGSDACPFEQCIGIMFNCMGVLLAGGLDISQGVTECNPAKEDIFVSNMNSSAAVSFGFGADYSNCTRYPVGWPIVCITPDGSLDPPAVPPNWDCAATAPKCSAAFEDGRLHVNPGTCNDYSIVPVGSDEILHAPVGDLVTSPGVGSLCDVRHPLTLERGCSPCVLIQNTDIIVTATDALGNSFPVEIHVN